MIVVDVNIIAYLLIAGEKTALAQAVYRKDPQWMVPHLWQHEFLNVLATYVRHGAGDLADGEKIWEQALTLPAGREQSINMHLALELATRHQVSGYDAQYVVLAVILGVPCVSEDQRLQKTFPQFVLSMERFLSLPQD